MERILRPIFYCALYMLVFVPGVFSQEMEGKANIHIGALELHPFGILEQKYDDNVFLEPDDLENDDWITTLGLGLETKMPLVAGREDDFMLKLKYLANIIEFWDLNEQDRVDHHLRATADFLFSNDWHLHAAEKFIKTADPPNSELTGLEKRWQNAFEISLGLTRETLGFDAGYKNIINDYKDLNNLDRTTHILSLVGHYYLTAKKSLFGEYKFGITEYDTNITNSDSEFHELSIGIDGNILQKLIGVFKVGYKFTDYDEDGKENFNGLTLFGNVTYLFSERTTFNLFAGRGTDESSYEPNSYYEYNDIGLNVEHLLLQKLFLVAGISFQWNRYPEETTEGLQTAKREDDFLEGEIGLRYEMKDWVFLETKYLYRERDSNFDIFDYTDNQYIAKIKMIF